MKITTINGYDYWVFLEHDWLIKFLEWQRDNILADFTTILKSGIAYDRWDHFSGKTIKTIHAMACIKLLRGDVAPFNVHQQSLSEYAMSFFSGFDRCKEDEVLVVNNNGGYTYFKKNELGVIKDFVIDVMQNVHLVANSKIITIENDPMLEEWTKETVKVPFSYILELRKFTSDQLKTAFWDWKKTITNCVHGSTLLVYTTGIDFEQMKKYLTVAKSAHIDVVLLIPSAGHSLLFDTAVEFGKSINLDVQVFDKDDSKLYKLLSE